MRNWRLTSERWRSLTFYQRFEWVVAFALTVLVTIVILVALFRLSVEIIGGLVFGALNPLEHKAFQTIFGQIMTVLIALEFNHTLRYVVNRDQSVIQTRTVLLIALLAMARRFIIMDLTITSNTELLGLAAVTLALGGTYWLMREREERAPAGRPGDPDAAGSRP
jgi:uncharacterized membrane protein (DUF373 family)